MTRKAHLPRLLAAALLSFLAAAGCSDQGSGAAATRTAVDAESEKSKPGERIAPEFDLPDIDGNPVKLSDSAGRVRLVDFWATWCAPCRDEVPMLNELHRAYADQGLQILAISDESAEEIREFVEEYDVVYTNLVGTPETLAEYGALGLPTAFLIDGEGKVVEFYFGPKPRKNLEDNIRKLLAS